MFTHLNSLGLGLESKLKPQTVWLTQGRYLTFSLMFKMEVVRSRLVWHSVELVAQAPSTLPVLTFTTPIPKDTS